MKHFAGVLGLTLCAVASVRGISPPISRADELTGTGRPFAVGVLRADGGLIPIGTYTGSRWRVTWPSQEIAELEIPITIESVPREWWGKPGRTDVWHLWIDGRAAGTVRMLHPSVLPVLCSPRIALSTDYQSRDPVPPPAVQPYPKVGVAVSSSIPIGGVEVLTASSPEWTAIGPALKDKFDDAEDVLASKWTLEHDPHPIDGNERHSTPVTIETMYATGTAGDRVYFVEASRKYDHSSGNRPLCAVAFGGGYFRRDGDRFKPLGMDMRVVPCSRRGLVYMLPLGTIRLGSNLFWIAQFSNWDFEQYEIIEFKRTRVDVAASTFGGRCEPKTAAADDVCGGCSVCDASRADNRPVKRSAATATTLAPARD
jgi:hypothetical protein